MIDTKKLEIALEEQKEILNKMKNHKSKINKYQKEYDELYNKLLYYRKNNRYNIWFSILSYLLSFLLLYYLKHFLSFNEIIDIILKIILYIFPHINCYYQINEYFNNYKEYKEIDSKYIIVSQNLFAEKLFLDNTKDKYQNNKYQIFILRKELGNLSKIENINNNIQQQKNKTKVLIKNLH